ncbi:MAG: P-loop NTPase fold protein, partial [Caulobacter sp.]
MNSTPEPPPSDTAAETPPSPEQPPPPSSFDGRSEYLSDTPAHDVDLLDRGEFAVALARRLHDIWCRRNGLAPTRVKAADAPDEHEVVADDTFIVHVDAPWGGGKTTFANFVAQVLNPRGARLRKEHFLNGHIEGLEKTPPPSLDGVFLGDYSPTEWEPHPRPGRRPWIIVRSNAWRYQDVEPPWWQIHLDVAKAIRRAALEDFRRHDDVLASPRAGPSDVFRAAGGMVWALWRWVRLVLLGAAFQLSNPRLLKHLVLTLLAFGVLLWGLRFVPWDVWNGGAVDPGKIKTTIELAVLGLGALGGGLASLGALVSQSLAPDLDFSGETKRIGVGDPIARFRKTFRSMLELGRRPVLLIVDDLDRCAPKQVVELLRGFQTILQSPRMFVMILGDRHWIETAHSVWHAEMKGLVLGPEASLGARFVEKVFQLSFVLPAMSGEARDRYTRAQLGGNNPSTDEPAAAAPTALARAVETALSAQTSASEREKAVHALIEDAKAAKVGDDPAEDDEVAAIQAAAASRITVEAVGDVELTRNTEKLLAGLAPLLPNNPRQIKRVINAFPLFAAVGAKYFGYRGPGLLSTDDDTRAWRQLALWVALSTEWPVTWRALAARPLLLDAAYAPEAADREAAIAALSAGG